MATNKDPNPGKAILRLRILIGGAVQGVGFRPFIYRLAEENCLSGFVQNSGAGVTIEAEGAHRNLTAFLLKIEPQKPVRASIHSLESSWLDPAGYKDFAIKESQSAGESRALILPDIAMCEDCRREVFNPRDRRYLYPFTNCTNCGPRFSIIKAMPYDRASTTMAGFEMCEDCAGEYNAPHNRRFHAQPIACPNCGPQVFFTDNAGVRLSEKHAATLSVIGKLKKGAIIALKGLGGYQLLVDAHSQDAITRLRQRKGREAKPLALMFPTLSLIREYCETSDLEERLLCSPEAPIVLLKKKRRVYKKALADGVGFNNPFLGVMLPYTPLHAVILGSLGTPVVATSGNLTDEPICYSRADAVERLSGIADFFLHHNRPIARHVDDSVTRVVMGRELILRRARGYAPLPIRVRADATTEITESGLAAGARQKNTAVKNISVIAVGGHLKNTVAFSRGDGVFLSQHIGDLETVASRKAFTQSIEDLSTLLQVKPSLIVHDNHPDYVSTHYAEDSGKNILGVQHHYAHVLSCMAENEVEAPVLGVSWDGTGLGMDNTIWGGEFLLIKEEGFERAASLRPFPLPGGESSIRSPIKTAFGLCWELYGEGLMESTGDFFSNYLSDNEIQSLIQMLQKSVNCPLTSSAGRIFDAVSAILGICQVNAYEGQAAIMLEHTCIGSNSSETYEVNLQEAGKKGKMLHEAKFHIDWGPMVTRLLNETSGNKESNALTAAKFHNTMADAIVLVCERTGQNRVALSGGCFQNAYLLEHTVSALQKKDFQVYWHQRVPTGDGGISLGQAVAGIGQIRNFKL